MGGQNQTGHLRSLVGVNGLVFGLKQRNAAETLGVWCLNSEGKP